MTAFGGSATLQLRQVPSWGYLSKETLIHTLTTLTLAIFYILTLAGSTRV